MKTPEDVDVMISGTSVPENCHKFSFPIERHIFRILESQKSP